MQSSSRTRTALMNGGAAFAACVAVGLAVALAACGGPSRNAGTPMAGSAAILPSPVKAERVPASDAPPNQQAPSASFAPATPANGPVMTLPSASASAKKQ
jgi:hypothetical protein